MTDTRFSGLMINSEASATYGQWVGARASTTIRTWKPDATPFRIVAETVPVRGDTFAAGASIGAAFVAGAGAMLQAGVMGQATPSSNTWAFQLSFDVNGTGNDAKNYQFIGGLWAVRKFFSGDSGSNFWAGLKAQAAYQHRPGFVDGPTFTLTPMVGGRLNFHGRCDDGNVFMAKAALGPTLITGPLPDGYGVQFYLTLDTSFDYRPFPCGNYNTF